MTDHWLTTPAALDAWLETLDPAQPLALDSEFERSTTFFPRPGLLQLAVGQDCRLVEPCAAEGSRMLRGRLESPAQDKLVYAMSEDVELLRHWLGVEVRGVLDLQIALALTGQGFSVGYARAVESVLGEVLDKAQTRSDWIRRPLTVEQEAYALADVQHLTPLWHKLGAQLQVRGLIDALREESARMVENVLHEDPPELHYRRLRGGWRLNARQQRIVQRLVAWREQQCRSADVPRNRVLGDGPLLGVAQRVPASLAALGQIADMHPRSVRQYGEQILAIVSAAQREPPLTPDERIPSPLSREDQDRYRELRDELTRLADLYAIPIELLAPRRLLEESVRQGQELDTMSWLNQGWRASVRDARLPPPPVHS